MLVFDKVEFDRAKFEARTKDVPIPKALHGIIKDKDAKGDDDTEKVWRVRALTGEEWDRAQETSSGMMLQIFQSAVTVIATVGEISDDLKYEYRSPTRAKRIMVLMAASIEPAIDRSTAINICDHFPVFATTLEKAIEDLTGMGAAPAGKSNGSTAPQG